MGSRAIAAAATVVLLVKLLAFVYQAVQARGWWRTKLHAAIVFVRSAVHRLRHANPRSELDEAVQSRMATFRRSGMHLAVTLTNCASVVILFGIIRDQVLDSVAEANIQQQVLSITVAAFFGIPQCLPSIYGRLWFAHAMYGCITVWCWVVFAFGSVKTRVVVAFIMQIGIVALHLASMRLWSSILWHTIFSAGMAIIMLRSEEDPVLQGNFLRGLLIPWVAGSALAGVIESSIKSVIQAEMESQGLQVKQMACYRLLRTFYDVILELDPELRIASGAADLGSFLHQGSSALPSVHTLQEVLPREEHRQLINERLRRESEGSADVLHLDMRSGVGETQAVELFSMSFPSMSGNLQHLVGIRAECGRDTAWPEAGAEPAGVEAGSDDRVSVLVSCAYKEMPILECSEAFNRKMGPIADGAMLEKFLVKRHRHGFHEWMDRVIDLQLAGKIEEALSMGSIEVRLRPQGHQRAYLAATCQVDLGQSLKDPDRTHMLLLFRDWQLGFRIRQYTEIPGDDGGGGGGGGGRGTPRTIGKEQVGHLPTCL